MRPPLLSSPPLPAQGADGKDVRTASGWSSNNVPKGAGLVRAKFDDINEWASGFGFSFKPHNLDDGIPGRYHGTHGEIQALFLNKDASNIGISTPSGTMCKSCQSFFSSYSQHTGRTITVTTDSFRYVFDGSGNLPVPVPR